MGILCITVSVLFGIIGFMSVITAQAVTGELFGAELLICACVLFGAGSICNEVGKARNAIETTKPKTEPTA